MHLIFMKFEMTRQKYAIIWVVYFFIIYRQMNGSEDDYKMLRIYIITTTTKHTIHSVVRKNMNQQ